MEFFKYLPKITYPGETETELFDAVNLTARFKIKDWILSNNLTFYNYTLTDEDRPDIVAHKYYGSTRYTWLLFITNDIIDPQFDWPLPHEMFLKYLAKKYKEQFRIWWENPIENPDYYKLKIEDWNVIDALQDETYKSGFDAHHYITTDGNDYWVDSTYEDPKTAVSYYTHEENLNEAKRNVKIIDNVYLRQLDHEMRKIFSEVQ